MAANVGQRPTRGRSKMWPVLLICLGTVFLLQNVGILPPNLWANLWRLWPLVLVLIGVEMLFRGQVRGLGLAGLILGLIVVGVVSLGTVPRIWSSQLPTETHEYSQPLQGAAKGSVRLEFDAGRLQLGALDPGGDRLAALHYEGPGPARPEQRFSVTREGVAELRWMRRHDAPLHMMPWFLGGDERKLNLTAWLTPDVPIALRVIAGAANAELDLTKLRISDLRMESGASKVLIRLPEAAGVTTAQLDAGASDVTIELPAGVGALVRTDGGLSDVRIENARLVDDGEDQWRTADYESSANRVDLKIDAGASKVTIR